jgi:hypothetical protein
MVLVYLTSGECIEVMRATTAVRVDSSVFCYDELGRKVVTLPADDVVAFTSDPAVASVMAEDVCDDVVVLPGGPDLTS